MGLVLFQTSLVWAQTDVPADPAAAYPPVTVTAPAQPYRQFEKIEITGSSIIRKEQTRALPVMVVTRQELRRSGVGPYPTAVWGEQHHGQRTATVVLFGQQPGLGR